MYILIVLILGAMVNQRTRTVRNGQALWLSVGLFLKKAIKESLLSDGYDD